MEQISLKLFSVSGAEGLSLVAILIGSIVLLSGAVLLMWFSQPCRSDSGRAKMGFGKNGIEKLFLPIDYRFGEQREQLKEGYLRSLTLKHVTLVSSDKFLNKGAFLDVDLGKVPNKAGDSCFVRGKIIRRKSLGGLPESWQLDIKLLEQFSERFSRICQDFNKQNDRPS